MSIFLFSSRTGPVVHNIHALNVVKRVKQKLDGSDGIERTERTGTVLSIPEQVDAMIREAISVKNLSKMYEGWTSWI
jgi:phosphatidylinositol kinase/protein kinase (PI-3  family)